MRLTNLMTSLAVVTSATAGPLGYGICQAGCSGVVVACYAAAGFTFGTVLAVAAPPAILVCNNPPNPQKLWHMVACQNGLKIRCPRP
ncbi:hypothetical protein IWZ03DRAFT_376873 [Phyllosticta citriasiana]|uniref:Hydrophobin n=1 Tax=Phyllosticta citriasiana TaxID=595635 RepID=A0ABR1KMK4_9PEZI